MAPPPPAPVGDVARWDCVQVHPAIVPEGYLLTTRLMRDDYFHESHGCPANGLPHSHPEHVVFWPVIGADSVEVDGDEHSVSVGHGVWVPAEVAHVVMRVPSSPLAAVHISPAAWDGPGSGVRPVTMRPSLRELLLYLMHAPLPKPQRLRAQRVCLELLAEEARPELELVVPQDERIATIVQALMTNPADKRSLEEWAWHVSMSSRTVARVFRSSTGMSFNEWRTHVRITRAVELLGEGVPVGVVARRVGYATIGAFSNACSRVAGRRPQEFHPPRS